MKFLRSLSLPLLAACWSFPAQGAQIIACVVADNLQGNPTYFGMATTVTKLRCEIANKDFFPTLPLLYQQGWRLIQVVGGDHAMSTGNRGPSPLYFLEREDVPPPANGGEQGNSKAGAAVPPKSGKK